MVIGFFLGLWVELPKGGFSQGGSSPSSSYEEHHPKQRHSLKSKKGNAGERKLGNLGSGSSSSSSLPPESADDGGELKMVPLCFPSQILELLLFLMTNASRKQGGKFVFNWFFLNLVQVFVVRQDLKMGSGKIASQCARKASSLLLIPNPKS
jgi:hypothetical protein